MGGKKKRQQKNEEQQDGEQTVDHHKKNKKDKESGDEAQKQQTQKPSKKTVQPKKVSYCPVCTLPFQFCKYGKKVKQCIKLLASIAPTKVTKYHPDADVQKIAQEAQNQIVEEPKKQKKEKSVRQKYIVIDVKQRAKKKFVTTITGLQIFGIDSKELSKKCSKKFACSASNLDADTAQIQGDVFEDVKQMLITEFKVKAKYIIDKEKFNQKFKDQMQKRKEQKIMAKNNTIKQAENEDEPIEEKPRKKSNVPNVKKQEPQQITNLSEKIHNNEVEDIDDI